MLHQSFKPHLQQVIMLFAKNKIKNAYLFGSVLTNKFGENSDVDFLVNFEEGLDPLEKGELWWELNDQLRATINREIDLVTESSLKNPYFIKELNETKFKIYGV